MNKKKVYLIFHPSHGRTGTTYLQEYIFPQTSVLNLGKDKLGDKKKKEVIKLKEQDKYLIPQF